LIEKGESFIRKWTSQEIWGGASLTLGLILFSWTTTYCLLKFLSNYSVLGSRIVEILLLYSCLSTKDLAVECNRVKNALEKGDLELAREKLSWVVGRDTENLNTQEISRAVVETVAENTVDGIVSPLLYAAIGGAPLAIAYKTINTLDSMIGHKTERYIHFGKLAAKIDTWANWIPSRITGFLFPAAAILAGFSAKKAFVTAWRDGASSPVQNSGIPEAAMAGALRVQLGGSNFYKGQSFPTPLLGEPDEPLSPGTISQSIRLMYAASFLFFVLVSAVKIFMERCF